MKATDARMVAAEVVTRVRERDAYAHETLAAALSRHKLSERDAGLATRLAYGTIACRGTLDEALDRFIDRPGSVEPAVRDRLCVSAYELLFARTPARAVVDQGVELVRAVTPRAAGLANAVLRKLAAEADSFPWGDAETDNAALSRAFGHPRWMTELFVNELGRDRAREVLAADNEPAPLFLAHLPYAGSFEEAIDVLSRDGAEPEATGPEGCIVAGRPAAAVRSAAVSRRQVLVADAGAQFAALVAMPGPLESVVELGAGRGTKSLMLAGRARLLGAPTRVTAVDVHGFKLDALKQAADELGVKGLETVAVDASASDAPALQRLKGADSVLVDAPCSGLGTLRRHPDRRWRALEGEIETLAVLGSRLLDTAASLVRVGGFVVYSTCTVTRRENEDVVEAFLASEAGRGFRLDSLAGEVPVGWEGFLAPQGWFRSLPAPGGPDGHFVARFVRDA